MTLFYHMPYVRECNSYKYPGLQVEMQKLIDTADCLYAWRDPTSEPDFPPKGSTSFLSLVQGRCDVIFPDGTDEDLLRKLFGLTASCFYNYLDVKMMRCVSSRKEAFMEINRFLEVNAIQTQYTWVRKVGQELRISLWGERVSGGKKDYLKPRVSFVLREDDAQTTKDSSQYSNGNRTKYKQLIPSEPDKYLQKYFDDVEGRE